VTRHREARQLSLAEMLDITENLGVSGAMQRKVRELGRALPGFMDLHPDEFSTFDVFQYVTDHPGKVSDAQMTWLLKELNADVKKKLARKRRRS